MLICLHSFCLHLPLCVSLFPMSLSVYCFPSVSPCLCLCLSVSLALSFSLSDVNISHTLCELQLMLIAIHCRSGSGSDQVTQLSEIFLNTFSSFCVCVFFGLLLWTEPGQTHLHCCSLPWFLFQGANPNCESKSGLPVLHLAAKNKHVDCIPVLVQAGADINAKGPSSM